jgi:hypothetical protein
MHNFVLNRNLFFQNHDFEWSSNQTNSWFLIHIWLQIWLRIKLFVWNPVGSSYSSQPNQVKTRSIIRPCLVYNIFLLRFLWFQSVFCKHILAFFWIVLFQENLVILPNIALQKYKQINKYKNGNSIYKKCFFFACYTRPSLSKIQKSCFGLFIYTCCVLAFFTKYIFACILDLIISLLTSW